ncbi:hypothetical protein GCM10010464_38730 [Pseudonocardia yunnanensis]|uniref:Uncharacterized protein n=1 Tax=Pseudonocardia yunnanensis TaxID=58107 RepID=A0ABW4EZN8_9PSEU
MLGHREWAPTRKVDPAFLDLDAFRARVAALCAAPATSTTSPKDDEPVTPERTLRAAFMAEAGDGSVAVDRAWITFGSAWGDSTMTITTLDPAGRVLSRFEDVRVANSTKGVVDVPAGCALATIEGTVSAAGALPAAALVCKAR